MIVVPYQPELRDTWNEFVRLSKNGTFLFDRNYMGYHAERFFDHSLMFFDRRTRLRALFPAHEQAGNLISHGGLTYGGVVSDSSMTTPMMLEVFDRILVHCRACGLVKVLYKTVPSIYAQRPAEEDRYALFRHQARLVRRDVLSVLEPALRLPFQERRTRKIKQARRAGFRTMETGDYASFWPLLERNLEQRHGTNPVHNLDEIMLLASRFPEEVRLHVSLDSNDRIMAGVVVYVTKMVAHVQYIATSEEGRSCGALDLLFAELIEQDYEGKRYFDFGISTEDNGLYLNNGLIEQKEGFGARAVVHDTYEMPG